MNPYSPDAPLAFLDLETTGANFARDRILEIGIVEVDAAGVREWSTLVNPGVAITPFISNLTGIDDTMVAGAPRFADIAQSLFERLHGRLFVAHSARFDHGFLKAEFARLGIAFRPTVLCTVKLSRKLFPKAARHNLDTLIERHGIRVEERHRALADARVLWALWQTWHRELGAETVSVAIAALVRPTNLPASLDPSLADELPDTHGAFALRDENGTILQFGRAANLRHKVFSLFADGRATRGALAAVHSIDWCGSAGEFGARLAEIAYQRELRPLSPELCSWRLEERAVGDYGLRLVMQNEARFGLDGDLYGLFANEREARQILRKLAEAHFLCPSLVGVEPPRETTGRKACSATCRGACIGKEPRSKHSARLMAAVARMKVQVWPHTGPVLLVERDEFGMLEDFHLFDGWRYLGRVSSEETCPSTKRSENETHFDPDIYRCLLKYSQGSRLRLIALPAAQSPDR